jgi:TP901 family phage tail tape measure protein
MATQQYKSEVELALKAPGIQNVEKTLDAILAAVDKIPASSKNASAGVADILKQISTIKKALSETGSLNSVVREVKGLAGTLKSISVLNKGLELFSNKDVDNINRAAGGLRAAARAYEEVQRAASIKKGTFGLDETSTQGTAKSMKVLQERYKALAQAISSVEAEKGRKLGASNELNVELNRIQKNIDKLVTYQGKLREIAIQKQQQAEEEKRLAKGAELNLVEQARAEDKARTDRRKAEEKALRDKAIADQKHEREQVAMFRKAQEDRRIAAEKNLLETAQLENKAREKRLAEGKKFEDNQKNQAYRYQDGRARGEDITTRFALSPEGQQAYSAKARVGNARTAQYASPGFEQAQIQRLQLSGLQQQIAAGLAANNLTARSATLSGEAFQLDQQRNRLLAERKVLLSQGLADSARDKSLAEQIVKLEDKISLAKQKQRRDSGPRKEAEEEARQNTILSRVKGAGGASLLAVQAALIANYAILNTAIGGVRAAITTSVELEAALKNVQAVTVTTDKDMGGLRDTILSLSSSSRFSSVELANASLTLGQAGLSAREVSQSLASVVQLATASGTSLAQTVDLVTSIVGVFDKQARDVGDVANKVTSAANSSKISVEKLGLALQYTGNAAAQTGVSFEETLAALAAMSNAGIKSGSTMGTGLRQFLTEIQKPSEAFLSTLSRIGLTVADVDVRSNGLLGVLQKLRAAGFVASDAIQSFDVRGAAAFNAVVANPADLARQYDQLLNTQAAAAATAIQMDSLQSQTMRLANTMANLATIGLEPIQAVLKSIVGSLADFAGGFQNSTAIVQGLTIAAASFIALNLAQHYGAMIPAMLPWLGVSKSMTATLVGMTTITLGQIGANVGLSASLTGVAATSTAASGGLLAMSRSLVAATTIAYAAGGAMGVLSLALGTLAAGLKALGALIMATPIGLLVLGASLVAAAGYMLFFRDKSLDAKDAMDKLQSEVDNAKASFEETEKKVESLTKKIDDLYYKELNLTEGSAGLRTTIKELNIQFGNMGLKLDENNDSFSTMIQKMKDLRVEMQNVAGIKLNTQLAAEKLLLNAKENQFTAAANDPGRQESIDKFEKFLFNPKDGIGNRKDISPSQQKMLRSNLQAARGSDTNAANALAQALSMATLLGGSDPLTTKRLGSYGEQFAPFLKGAVDLDTARSNLGNTQLQTLRQDEVRKFEGLKTFPKKGSTPGADLGTFDESYSREYNILEKINKDLGAKAPKTALAQYMAIREAVFTEAEYIKDSKTALKRQVADGSISAELAAKKEAALNAAESAFKGQGTRYYSEFESRIGGELKDAIELQKVKSRKPGQEGKDAMREVGRLEGVKITLGSFSSGEQEELRAKNRAAIAQARIDNRNQTTGARDKNQLFNDESKAYKMQADVFAFEAKGKKITAAASDTIEQVTTLMDEGAALLRKENEARITALKAEQKARGPSVSEQDTNFRKMELAELKDKGEEAVAQFYESASGIYKAIAKKKSKLGLRADLAKSAQTLKNLEDNAEEALFDAGSNLREINNKVAQKVLPAGSVAERQATLDLTQFKIAQLAKELEVLGDNSSGYIGSLVTLLANLNADIVDLESKIASETNPAKKAPLQAMLGVAIDDKATVEGNLNSARGRRRTARGSYATEQNNAFSQAEALPMTQSWDALEKKLISVGKNYAQTVQEMDMMGGIANGIEGQLSGLTNGFASLFTNLVDGSMTAGQAFRTFAAGIVKGMLDIIAQALAMAALKSIIGAFLPGFGSVGAGASSLSSIAPQAGGTVVAAEGGLVTGGIKGKDSVPVMTMPGEYILKKSAVDALGAGFVADLNSNTTGAIDRSGAGSNFSGKKASKDTGTMNVWVVMPEAAPQMGARDVVAIISNDMMTNGTTKKLVTSIATGQM